MHDIVAFARSHDPPILCQGRGSAANSAVCYCLGITAVDPATSDLLFERFISEERSEPPDIDVDFEHERREEVIQYIYRRYTAATAPGSPRPSSTTARAARSARSARCWACREDVTAALATTVWGSHGRRAGGRARRRSRARPRRSALAAHDQAGRAAARLPAPPVAACRRLRPDRAAADETVPIDNAAMDDRTFIEWDKDDIDALGMIKVDVLALGMLTCIRKAST